MPPNFQKMFSYLNHCHRCHQEILNLSAKLFYKTELKIPENEPQINHPKFPYPLLFVCSSIDEKETIKSTRNDHEAEVILDYAEEVAANWSKRAWGGQYHLDMCVMSPTRSQVRFSSHFNSNKHVFIFSPIECTIKGIKLKSNTS